jgi:ATP-dependent DNA helicase RecQ
MTVPDSATDLERTLRERFGLERFRPGQREVIEKVIEGRDVLCVMPTGGGKSLCYQLPAVVLPGVTLVVSPLIALMKDQVDALTQRGIRATLINSTLDPSEQHARILDVEAGRYDLVYVAPERFRSGRFVEMMARVKPALLAVDEAHCISEWGHDFRPDYARIGLARKKLGSPPCIALTATATDVVRRDIADQLDLHDPAIFVTGFDRPNLTYAALQARREIDKLVALGQILDENRGSAIVYASSRARCESVAEHLRREQRRTAVVYHAGLTREQRHEAQDRFMGGVADVVVATNAFGMGVDKPDIRAVVHFNMPGTLEAYYQEAGRAGRDGFPASCVLFHAPGDRILQERFIENEYPPPDVVFQVYNFLRRLDADPIELTQAEIRAETGIDLAESAIGTALKLLEGAGAVERFLPRENMAIVRINAEGDEPGSLAGRVGAQAHVQRTVLLGLEGLVNGRYAEPIYFHPDDFAATLGLDRPALSRAIRALTSELPIDYVPPFRGNAIRVNDRNRKPREIEIDFVELQARKKREYDKLDRMVKYAQTSHCRRAFLLSYFGDAQADRLHCGRCDNCGIVGGKPGSAPTSPPIDTPSGLEVILKVLSGVARAKGRFGKTMVAQMLKGSASEKMDRWNLKSLSTFGILPNFSQTELCQILDALTSTGYVDAPEVDRFRPIVDLSAVGWEYLKTRPADPLRLPLPDDLLAKIREAGPDRKAARAAPAPTSESGPEPGSAFEGDPLYERLRALRLEWAREGKMPAYSVFNNQTLEELVRIRPRTPSALAAVKGVGPSRLERYGKALLETIAAETNDVEEPAPEPLFRTTSSPPPSPSPLKPPEPVSTPVETSPEARSTYVPTEEWTWRLLERGFTLDDAAAIRGLDRAALIRHVSLVARQGKPVEPGWDAWLGDRGDAAPPPDGHGSSASDLWVLFVACRRGR